MTNTYIEIPPRETRNLLDSEINELQEAAGNSGDQETLAILDFIKADRERSTPALEMVLMISARFAKSGGLSKLQWMQTILGRHAADRECLETIWRALTDLHVNGDLPWPN